MNQDFPSSNKRMKKSITHPGESLFSSLNDNVIEIMETWRVNSTLHHMDNSLEVTEKQKKRTE
jgi:glutamine synthetase type III